MQSRIFRLSFIRVCRDMWHMCVKVNVGIVHMLVNYRFGRCEVAGRVLAGSDSSCPKLRDLVRAILMNGQLPGGNYMGGSVIAHHIRYCIYSNAMLVQQAHICLLCV